MKYVRTYFIKGAIRDKRMNAWLDYAIKDPPVAGNTCCFILGEGKRLTIFHPFTITAYTVPSDCTEIKAAQTLPYDRERLATIITKRWRMYKELDMQRAYSIAAQVLIQLGGSVPEHIEPEKVKSGPKPEKKSGKPLDTSRFKIVKRKSRRGQVAEFFIHEPQPILEAMAKLNFTRSGILSQLYMLWKDHGIGYEVQHDSAFILTGGQEIFDEPIGIVEEDLQVPDEEDIFQ